MTARFGVTGSREIAKITCPFSFARWSCRSACLLAVSLMLAAFGGPRPCFAAGTSQNARFDDLHMTVDTQWAGCRHGGYFPVRIRITNAGRARNVTVTFSDRGYATERLPTVERTLTLEQNSTQQFALSIPLVNESFSGLIQVRTDRGSIPELNVPVNLAAQADFGEEQPALLVIANDLVESDMAPFATAADYLSRPKGMGTPGISVGGASSRDAKPQVISAGTMVPEAWVDYSGVDIVAVSLSALQKVPEGARSALLKWTAQGGTLIIYDVGQPAESSAELLRLLDVDNRAAISPKWAGAQLSQRLPMGIVQEGGAVLVPGWKTTADIPENAGQLSGKMSREGNPEDMTGTSPSKGPANPSAEEAKKLLTGNRGVWSTDTPPFQRRDVLLGRVYAFAGKPFPGSALDWGWFLRDLGSANWRWSSRMGLEHRQQSLRFAEFSIPSVGEVPAKMFLVLITLFTIVIGPLNYLVLNRRKQLYLLIVTIPAMAFVTSISLFLYALVADGLDVKARLRSITLLDQRSREAVSLCRAGFYAGLPPWGGLRFSADTLILPVLQVGEPINSASVSWTRAQDLTNGWLRSRTPTQFSFRSHRVERGRLEIGNPAGDTEVEVSNGFPWDIHRLVVKADDGHLYYGKDLRAGGTARLRRINLADDTDRREITAMSNEIGPAPPPVSDQSAATLSRSTRHMRSMGYSGRPVTTQLVDDSRIPAEYAGSQAEQLLNHARTGIEKNDVLSTRSYVATFTKSPGIDCGLGSITEVSPAHVMLGRY